MGMPNNMRKVITYATYPMLLATTLSIMIIAIEGGWNLKTTLWIYLSGLLITLITLERLFPLSPQWGMTTTSFLRDIKYLLASGATIAAVRWSFGFLAIGLAEKHQGFLAAAPWWVGLLAFLLLFDLLQYGWHRWSHSHPWLWRIHLAHHLPERVYVIMHPVFHPLNALINAALLQGVILLLGLPPQAVFAVFLILDLQTMVSHFNVDIRAGILNYVLVGTELHRYHHSADIHEAKNFGTVLPLWDILFGTFVYKPGIAPAALGVSEAGYPASTDFWKVMALPFRRG